MVRLVPGFVGIIIGLTLVKESQHHSRSPHRQKVELEVVTQNVYESPQRIVGTTQVQTFSLVD